MKGWDVFWHIWLMYLCPILAVLELFMMLSAESVEDLIWHTFLFCLQAGSHLYYKNNRKEES